MLINQNITIWVLEKDSALLLRLFAGCLQISSHHQHISQSCALAALTHFPIRLILYWIKVGLGLLVHNWYFFSFCSFFASFKGIDSEIKKANDRVDSLLKAFNLKLIFLDYSVPITNLKLSLVTLHSRVPSQNFKVIPLKNYIDSLTLITQPL